MVKAVLVSPNPDAVLRPSQAVRWVLCSGSHALEAHYPQDEESPEARQGTAAHYQVTETLHGRIWPVGTLAPNGHPIDEEMVECGQLYIDDVRAELSSATLASYGGEGDVLYYVEAKVYGHKTIHPKNEGTPDTFMLFRSARKLVIWDYKYGHRYVDPFNNWQMVDYAGCIFETFGITRDEAKEWTVSIRVVQPRNYHRDGPVRRWDTTGRVIVGLLDQMSAAARKAKERVQATQTGPWCRDCSARRGCDAFMRSSATAMDVASDTMTHELPAPALGLELRNLHRAKKVLEARIDALEEQAIATIRGGQTVPYYTIGYVQGRERWTMPAAQVFALGEAFERDLRKPVEPVTPAAARKLGIDPAVVKEFTETPTGAAKVVSADETAAAKAFGH